MEQGQGWPGVREVNGGAPEKSRDWINHVPDICLFLFLLLFSEFVLCLERSYKVRIPFIVVPLKVNPDTRIWSQVVYQGSNSS